jgi:hypothetical protein
MEELCRSLFLGQTRKMNMEFRRSGTRDERRRRVIMEETCARGAEPDASESSTARGGGAATQEPPRRYSEGASSSHQPRVTDLMPHRPWTLLVVLLLCATFVTGLIALHGYLALERYPVAVEMLPAVNLAAANNLSVWFCSAMLAAGAVLSMLIYQIRRYRTDDYRGRYRMWFWFAGVLVLGSVNAVADVEYAIRTAALHAAGIPDYQDALLIGTGVVAFMLLVLVLRLALEMRSSWPALISLAISATCLAAVLAVRLGWLWTDAQMFRVMARACLMMVGHAALFFSLCLYGSRVYREANGLSKPATRTKKPRRKRRKPDQSEQDSEPPRAKRKSRQPAAKAPEEAALVKKRRRASRDKEAAEHEQTKSGADAKPAKRRVDQPVRSQQSEDDEPAADDMTKLSKAERRRLRKQRRRERQHQ